MSWSRAVATPDEARAALADPGDALDLRAAAELDERWSAPLGGRFTSSLPGFDEITLDELVRRTLAVAGAPAAA